MGTRHLVCVFYQGEYRIAQYGQWDGYPEGQGADVLEFLREHMIADRFKTNLLSLQWATDEDIKREWEDCGADTDSDMVSMEVSARHANRYPWNSRDTGAGILKIVQECDPAARPNDRVSVVLEIKPLPKIVNSIDFAADSLFCEWCYVIDFDKGTFEVYKGFNQTPLSETERFYAMTKAESRDKYHPVSFAISWSLDDLPTKDEFIAAFDDEEDDDS